MKRTLRVLLVSAAVAAVSFAASAPAEAAYAHPCSGIVGVEFGAAGRHGIVCIY